MIDTKQFLSAIQQIAEEKGIPKEKIVETIEDAIAAAYKRDYGEKGWIVRSQLNADDGDIKVFQIKYVVSGVDEEGYLTGELPQKVEKEKEILIHTTAEDFEDKARVLMSVLNKIDNDKVRVRVNLSGDPYKVRRIASRNELKIKESNQNGKFFAIDKKELLLMIQPENVQDEVGVWVNSPYFANSLTAMLDKVVKNGN